VNDYRILSILLIALFFIGNLPHQASAENVLPPQSNTQGYVNNLIDSYNALVNSHYARNSNFDTVKANFTLYHATGNTFKVIVLQSVANVSGYVTLVFIPIGGNQPAVIMDPIDNFSQSGLGIAGENVTLEHLTFEFSNTITYYNVALGMKSTDITGDYMTYSTKAAKSLYQLDASTISQHTATPPSQTQNSDNPILIIGGLVVAVFIFVFGSLSGFFDFVFDKEHKRFKRLFRKRMKNTEAES
jgi:hypothetical protein